MKIDSTIDLSALPLTRPAEKRTASALHDPLNWRGAGSAILPLAAIDVEAVLEIAELAVCIAEIPQATPTCFNGGCEDVFNMSGEGVRFRDLQPARRAARGNARPVKRFADIYIAESRDNALVQQGGFDLGFFPF